MIWKCATNFRRRVVMVCSSIDQNTVTFKSKSQAPSILQATKESREVGFETYGIIIQDNNDPLVRKYINFNTDIVVFDDLMPSISIWAGTSLAPQWKSTFSKVKIIELDNEFFASCNFYSAFIMCAVQMKYVIAVAGLKDLRELRASSVWYHISDRRRADRTIVKVKVEECCKEYLTTLLTYHFAAVEGYKAPQITFLTPNNV